MKQVVLFALLPLHPAQPLLTPQARLANFTHNFASSGVLSVECNR